jgi:hypothetical protein
MRTTITLSPLVFKFLKIYVKNLKPKMGPRINLSSSIDEAIEIACPVMFSRLQRKGESEKAFYLRRIADLNEHINRTNNCLHRDMLLIELANVQLKAYTKGFIKKLQICNNKG